MNRKKINNTIIISGKKVDIMNPRAIGACNDKIANEVIRIIQEADRQAELHHY